jgi:O-antigen ligase
VAGVAATCLVSIFASQGILFSAALLVQVARVLTGRARFMRLSVDAPILAFCVWTLLSASFSRNPLESFEDAKKLVLFLLFYLAVDVMSEERARERVLAAALLGGLVLSAGVVLQFYCLGFDTINNRPHSFLGHYMTASGLSMGVLLLAVARLAFGGRQRARPVRRDVLALCAVVAALLLLTLVQALGLFAVTAERLFVAVFASVVVALAVARGPWPGTSMATLLAWMAAPVAVWALLISRTRNAWIGAVVGLGILAILRAPKFLWLLGAAVLGILVARPQTVMDRLAFDASSADRYYMWQAGIDMIVDKPVFGQGPGRVIDAYPVYRLAAAPNALTPHMHNNVLQLAVERGLPCLGWWLWLVAALLAEAWREMRRSRTWGAYAAFAVLWAILAAGMFEYNFGDSEILMFVLIVGAIPFALRRSRALLAA